MPDTFRYWFVNCLGCKNPIPLFAEPTAPADSSCATETVCERPFFRAWCVECGREYPYLAESMLNSEAPPTNKHHKQIEFSQVRQRLQFRRAHA